MAETAAQAVIGQPTLRTDARLKVTGAARYPSDEPAPNAAYAFLVTSGIARGRVAGFHLQAAQSVPGVVVYPHS